MEPETRLGALWRACLFAAFYCVFWAISTAVPEPLESIANLGRMVAALYTLMFVLSAVFALLAPKWELRGD